MEYSDPALLKIPPASEHGRGNNQEKTG